MFDPFPYQSISSTVLKQNSSSFDLKCKNESTSRAKVKGETPEVTASTLGSGIRLPVVSEIHHLGTV